MWFFFKHKLLSLIGFLCFFVVVTCAVYVFGFRAPRNFPRNEPIAIPTGKGLSEIAQILKDEHIVRSTFWFTNMVILFEHETRVVGGLYLFEYPLNVYDVAKRVSRGTYNMNQIKTTIPEGTTMYDISAILKKNYPDFDTTKFLNLAKTKEGYIFPDTYYFGADVTPEKVIETTTATFEKRINKPEVQEAIKAYGKPLDEVMKVASIVEAEARLPKTRKIVAGILWERMRRGIPLQVDASFRYVNGKTTKDLTLEDLRIDNPYNTYLYKGLPPTPISNPGLESILAAVTPIKTDYIYFLTGNDDIMYYARTLDEHALNIELYLR